MADDEDLDLEELEGPAPLRKAYEAQKRRVAELEGALPDQIKEAEARGAAQAERKYKAVQLLEKHGYSEPLAEVWISKAPDAELTPEAASSFLQEMGLGPKDGDGEGPKTPSEPVTPEDRTEIEGFQDTTPASSTGQGKTNAEIRKLLESDPAAAMKAIHDRVQS